MIIPKRKWRYPLAIEREYAKMLVSIVKKKFSVIKSLIPDIVNAIHSNAIHYDGIGDWIGNIVDKVKKKVEKAVSSLPIINRIFKRVDKHVKTELKKTFESVGVKPNSKAKPQDLEMLKTYFTSQNTTLIKSIDNQIMERIRFSLSQKIISTSNKEKLQADLTQEIQDIAGVSEKRAALIGADQVGKLNGKLTQYQQMAAGIERFIWRTMLDNRVRPSHRAKEGVIFHWISDVEKPGEAIRCRCVAQPVIEGEEIESD